MKRKTLVWSSLLAGGLALSGTASAAPLCDAGRELSQMRAGIKIGENIVNQGFAQIDGDLSLIEEFKSVVVGAVGRGLGEVARSAASADRQASPALICRAQGLIDGVIERLSQLQEETACGEQGCEGGAGSLSSEGLSPTALSSEALSSEALSSTELSLSPGSPGAASPPASTGHLAPGAQKQGSLREFLFCWMDGVFWGELTSSIYCALAVELDGLEALGLELPPPSRSCCGFGFELACNLKFHVDARNDAECRPFSEAPHTAAYLENRTLSCTFEL